MIGPGIPHEFIHSRLKLLLNPKHIYLSVWQHDHQTYAGQLAAQDKRTHEIPETPGICQKHCSCKSHASRRTHLRLRNLGIILEFGN